MNTERLLLPVLILVFLVSCTGLQQESIKSDELNCPKQTTASIVAKQSQLGLLSDSHTLNCTLTVLHNSTDPAIRRSSLGSRLSFTLAERETNPENRERLANDGVDFAKVALEQESNPDGAVYYYLAANLGLAVRDHITEAMANLSRLESSMQRAVDLSPDIDYGGPMRLLGTLYLKAPAWPNGIGDRDKALELLGKAVKKHPEHPLNHLFYAEALWDEGEELSQTQAKTEYALGQKLLTEGNWGYNKAPWGKEFSEFKLELGEADARQPNR